MKSNTKKRLIAFMLCMVLVLSSATSAFADEPQNTDSQSQAEVVTEPVADEATGNEATGNEATGDEAILTQIQILKVHLYTNIRIRYTKQKVQKLIL